MSWIWWILLWLLIAEGLYVGIYVCMYVSFPVMRYSVERVLFSATVFRVMKSLSLSIVHCVLCDCFLHHQFWVFHD